MNTWTLNSKHHTTYNHSKKKKKEYLGANLTLCVEDLYADNYKVLVKEIKENQNKCRDISRS